MKLAIVIPCFNEESSLLPSFEIIKAKLEYLVHSKKIDRLSKIVFVDDGSNDDTWKVMEQICSNSNSALAYKLSRNFGQQAALLAGLEKVANYFDSILTMDIDLQDDIEIIENMISQYQLGNEIIYGVRSDRENDSFLKRNTAQLFYKTMSIFGAKTIYNHSDYRMISNRALLYLLEYKEVNLFLRGVFPLIGLQYTTVSYKRKKREHGTSKYPLRKMISFAINGITSFSIAPLRLATFLGIMSFSITLLLTFWAFYSQLTGNVIKGWSSTVISIYFLGSIQLICIGILGEYIGKIYMEVKKRPRYIIETNTLNTEDIKN